jgi:hypothetical protein
LRFLHLHHPEAASVSGPDKSIPGLHRALSDKWNEAQQGRTAWAFDGWRGLRHLRDIGAVVGNRRKGAGAVWFKAELPDRPLEIPAATASLRALRLLIERAPRTDDGRAIVNAELAICLLDAADPAGAG